MMNSVPEMIETERLLLRSPSIDDGEALFDAYASDPEVTRFLRWTPKTSPDDMNEFLSRALDSSGPAGEAHRVLETRDDRRPIGMISVRWSEHGAELGFTLARREWGKGYMPEAAGAIVEWLLRQPAIFRVWAYCDCDNVASARVLEKLGFHKEGKLRRWAVHPNISDEPRDSFMYSKVR